MKEQIKEIIFLASETKKVIREKSERFNKLKNLAITFHEALGDEEFDHLFELDEFKESHLNEFLDRELDDLFYKLFTLRNDLDEIISEETDSKLETALNLVHQAHAEYETLDEAIEGIEKCIELLKQMI